MPAVKSAKRHFPFPLRRREKGGGPRAGIAIGASVDTAYSDDQQKKNLSSAIIFLLIKHY